MTNNVKSADNQQERLNPWWIVGFVDGEGCFSVSRFKNHTCKSGYQTLYEFIITQSEISRSALEAVQNYFSCGHIYINRRKDNHKTNLLRYCVRKKSDLMFEIIPLFERYSLQTNKRSQYLTFRNRLMDSESSETICQG